MLTKKINAGVYTVQIGGRVFDVERYPDGAWLVFEVVQSEAVGGRREYMQDFSTKRAALASLPRHA